MSSFHHYDSGLKGDSGPLLTCGLDHRNGGAASDLTPGD